MRESDKVRSSESGKARLKQAYKEAGLKQDELARQAIVSVDTLKRLLGTKDCPNGVERQAVKNIAKILKIKPTDIVDVKDWYPQQQLPAEFERLIYEKTQLFCGRKFVFDSIEDFFQNNPNGYFTIIGDAGMGKSAISAKYVLDNPETICFFNIRAEGTNRPELFLKKIRQQLIARFQLPDVADADLSTLLTKAKEKLSTGERLIIVVDALDEVDQEGTANILYLPTILPDGVYFILTRRPYNQNEKRLNLSPSIPTQELDLREKIQESVQDVKEYIRELLSDGKYQQGLAEWIQQQNHISHEDFVETIAVKSENNFMYLRCILPAIAEGYYKDKPLNELPVGLEGYYENHWHIMGMTAKPLPKNKIKIVYVMCALRSAASREVIAKYSKQNALTVQEVLDGWAQFLQKQESYQPPRYRFYHESFREFLHRRDIVQAVGVNLPDIGAEVANNMTEGLIL
ncbi:helix-turn-helix domain-containing protein [Calothrix sp. PCC 6303]|uniref:helix-turn-helix domain-containing protein n=1 Tax=Calothrix sp. PCC 6303 TaxID=1170562 RepID=UPI0002A0135E|nr:helix-turn-helix domain-containing protein [Calothrix sp. PCC 6303]AFZ02274.1 helix-turn-helix domain protein [Calothrix sp. PCC 6303]